jgi:hypothetical protein
MGSAARARCASSALVAGLVLLCFAGSAASRPQAPVEQHQYQWYRSSDGAQATIERESGGPITSLQFDLPDAPCSDGSATRISPTLSSVQVPVAADGSFGYDGPDEFPGIADSHLQLSGRFQGDTASGTFSYSGFFNIGTCHTRAPVSFTAECVDCPTPPGGGGTSGGGGQAGGGGAPAAERFVPFEQLGRAGIGHTLAQMRARYPAKLYGGSRRETHGGGTVAFFHTNPASEDGDPKGATLMVRADAAGRIWSEAASSRDIDDPSSWIRSAAGVGIGSTMAQVRAAYPALDCQNGLNSNTCVLTRDTKAARRLTVFTFGEDVRGHAATGGRAAPNRVWALVVMSGGVVKAKLKPKAPPVRGGARKPRPHRG